MTLKKILFSFLFFSGDVILAGTTSSLKDISVVPAFEYFVEKPNHLTVCESLLWTFSEHDQSLIAIDMQSGKVRHTFAMSTVGVKETPVDTSALTCFDNRLLMLINSKTHPRIVEWKVAEETLKAVNQFELPGKTRSTDLFCTAQKCWLIQGTTFESANLKSWTQVKIPESSEMKKADARPDLDPFEDWQSDLILAKANYTKVSANKKNQVLFLDPFRQQVAVLKNTEWNKWGKFGGWEGSFMAPKAICIINEELVAVADAKLKAISVFTLEGKYVGVLTLSPDKAYTPDYPLGIAADGNRIFVSDFSANKVTALDIKKFENTNYNSDLLAIRKNLFRRPEVMKDAPSLMCMNCHDGTVSNQLFKYITTHFHHPLECSQCHEPHHNSGELHNLRKPESQLCQSCHKDYANPLTNHVWGKSSKKGGACIDCHKSHTDNEKLLVEKKTELCMNCHLDVKIDHVSTKLITDIDINKQMLTKNGSLTCQTCHQTHVNFKDKHFIKPPATVLTLCSSCHGESAPNLFKNFHNYFGIKKGKR